MWGNTPITSNHNSSSCESKSYPFFSSTRPGIQNLIKFKSKLSSQRSKPSSAPKLISPFYTAQQFRTLSEPWGAQGLYSLTPVFMPTCHLRGFYSQPQSLLFFYFKKKKERNWEETRHVFDKQVQESCNVAISFWSQRLEPPAALWPWRGNQCAQALGAGCRVSVECSKRVLNMNVDRSLIHNCTNSETKNLSFSRWVDKQAMAHHTKECYSVLK